MIRFRRAMEINNTRDMEGLCRSHEQHAINSIILICEQISIESSDRLEAEIAAFRTAWTGVFRSGFVSEVYEYFSLLRPQFRDDRRRLKVNYDRFLNEFIKAQNDEDDTAYDSLAQEFAGLAEAFTTIGDDYHTSQAWLNHAIAKDETLRGGDADLQAAWSGYRSSLAARDEIELRDSFHSQMMIRKEALEAMGYGSNVEEGGLMPGEAELGEAAGFALAFEALEEVDEIVRPNWNADELYPVWGAVYLRERDSEAKFQAMDPGLSPTFIRSGASEVTIDTDGDGEGDVGVPLTGNNEYVQFEIGDAEGRRPWGMFVRIGSEQDYYQGIQTNLGPSDLNMSLYVSPAGSMGGTIGETRVRIFDDNMDGIYGSVPKSWQYGGVIAGSFQQDIDSILIEGDDRARPWSEYQLIDESWYQLEVQNGGTSIVATDASVETGVLSLKYRGPDMAWLVVKGTGPYENCYFDVMQNGRRGVDVPPGEYELFCGMVSKGRRRQTMKALVLPGEDMQTWTVVSGEELEIELGQPFGFDFEFVDNGDSVTVLGQSISVQGSGGELYQRLWNCPVQPEASVRVEGSRRGSSPEEMDGVTDQATSGDTGWWTQVWFPYDLELEKRNAEDRVEVQLTEKKHKLFGKVESDWQG